MSWYRTTLERRGPSRAILTMSVEHGSYGAFYKDTSNAPAPTKITFD